MLRNQLIILMLIGGFMLCLGCEKPQEKPTIEPEKMAAIISDIFVADAAVTSAYGTIRDTMQAYYYDQVFKIHGVTREELDKNMAIYSKSTTEMDSLLKAAERILKE